jgi:rfaE bifunctional protein nucleotidyltransferase chain/domain
VPGRLPLAVPVPVVTHGDPCGAGDCFAATATVAATRGMVLTEAVHEAVVAASRFVADGGVRSVAVGDAPTPDTDGHRRRTGTVVATSGCFDLLHAGHVSMLEAARALGDSLVVLLNSDASVQDLKGAERPIVAEDDRAAVLRSLQCVDDVVVFDELTPVRALERLRPQLFVKGDDYGAGDIPETRVMRRWGGAVVVVPYLEGRSTSGLIEEVHRER